jgi:hypothetical protein
MTKVRLLLVSMLALLTVRAVASASASAAECVEKTGAQCSSVGKMLTAEVKGTGTKKAGTTSRLVVAGIGTVTCSKASAAGTLDETETGVILLKLIVTFSEGCKLEGHATCKVAEPITTNAISGTLAIAAGVGTQTTKPEVGEEFVKVAISGCEQEAIMKITGAQKCKIPNIEVEAVTHEVTCAPSESSLKDGAKVVEFEVTGISELESKAAFADMNNLF